MTKTAELCNTKSTNITEFRENHNDQNSYMNNTNSIALFYVSQRHHCRIM